MRRSILALAAATLPLALIACGSSGGGNTGGTGGGAGTGGDASTSSSSTTTSSSGSTTTSSSSSSSTTTSSSSSGSTACGVSGTKDTCQNACDAIFECGLLTCGGAAQLCPSFGPNGTTKDEFVPGCVQGCMMQMALLAVVDPNKCDQTISTLSGFSPDFKMACGN